MTDPASPFPHVMSPITIGGRPIRNRVLVSAHHTNLSAGGVPSPAMTEYYVRRARGGVGLIVTEAIAVEPRSRHMAETLRWWQPGFVDALGVLVERVQAEGAAVVCQLLHTGRQQDATAADGGPVAPSAIAERAHRQVPHALTAAEIEQLVGSFSAAAGAAASAGADGVEIHLAHGYLLAQFLDPGANARDDAYGGTRTNRLRFPRAVIDAARGAVGAGAIVGLRVDGGGPADRQDAISVTADLAHGVADYVSVSAGDHERPEAVIPPMGTATAPLEEAAAAFSAQLDVPVFCSHRIRSLDVAERIVGTGAAAMVNMARAHIADPDLVTKTLEGVAPRPCIGCIQGCVGRVNRGQPISCLVNPSAGQEGRRPSPGSGQHVAVVGAGVAGLQAAIALAGAGERPVVFEADASPGGMLARASRSEARREMTELLRWQTSELERLDIELHLSRRVTAADLAAFDAVVLATGSSFSAPPWDLGAIPVVSPLDPVPAGASTVVIIDDADFHSIALTVAVELRHTVPHVVIVTTGAPLAHRLENISRRALVERLRSRATTTFVSLAEVIGADGRDLHVLHEGHARLLPDVSAVVAVTARVATAPLPGLDVPVVTIGDCHAPRDALVAVREGAHVLDALRLARSAPVVPVTQ